MTTRLKWQGSKGTNKKQWQSYAPESFTSTGKKKTRLETTLIFCYLMSENHTYKHVNYQTMHAQLQV